LTEKEGYARRGLSTPRPGHDAARVGSGDSADGAGAVGPVLADDDSDAEAPRGEVAVGPADGVSASLRLVRHWIWQAV